VAGILGLKVDVDTYRGMAQGVPRLLSLLDKAGAKATFYLSIGPDASGRALLQLIKNPRFLRKMVRTRAASLYGWKTAFYGTLLPSPMIALSFPGIVNRLRAEGHEVQFHAWDHRRWQDELPHRSEHWIRDWFVRGISGFERLTGERPSSFGAPAWLIDDRVLKILGEYAFAYVSCTRSPAPFVHKGTELLEIPSDLPCFEEVGNEAGLPRILERLREGKLHVLPVHAEVEGGPLGGAFTGLLAEAKRLGYQPVPLREIVSHLDCTNLPRRHFSLKLLPGRSVPCAL
jgi:undecaprenyl phosphate-alpha-L-ara4FN deformylase